MGVGRNLREGGPWEQAFPIVNNERFFYSNGERAACDYWKGPSTYE
jgi:hypothetical protein